MEAEDEVPMFWFSRPTVSLFPIDFFTRTVCTSAAKAANVALRRTIAAPNHPQEPALKYSIIIPAYNESERLPATLEKVMAHIAEHKWDAEVLVVNDGSRDNTAGLTREFGQRFQQIRLLENPGNRGKGYSVRHGMAEGAGDVLLLTDADLSAPIYEAGKLFTAIEQGADVAIGSRWLSAQLQIRRQPVYRQITGRIFNLLLRTILRLPQKDTQCGFKAYTREAAKSIFPRQKVERWGFDAENLFLARKLGFTIAEIPVEWANDERSKIHPIRDGFSIVWDMVRVRLFQMQGEYKRLERITKP
jgi:dolichyl-phosphate beta-glucosyltransferase